MTFKIEVNVAIGNTGVKSRPAPGSSIPVLPNVSMTLASGERKKDAEMNSMAEKKGGDVPRKGQVVVMCHLKKVQAQLNGSGTDHLP
jgi:hypothetical protein